MKTNSIALGAGHCSPNRIALTAREFTAQRGQEALKGFLRAAAGVSTVADVAEADRFRVNAAMRVELNADVSKSPQAQKLARIGAKAFAKMVVRK